MARKFGAVFASLCHTFCFLQLSRRFACSPEIRTAYLLLYRLSAGFLVVSAGPGFVRGQGVYIYIYLLCGGRSWVIPYWFLWLEPAAPVVPASSTIPPAVSGIFTGPYDLWKQGRAMERTCHPPLFQESSCVIQNSFFISL